MVTAKDKLRLLLGKGLVFDGSAVCFSSEKADKATLAGNGIDDARTLTGMPVPDVYSAELSEFVFAAGVEAADELQARPHVSVDHRLYPAQICAGHAKANDFYAMMDRYLGELDAAGAIVVIVADHGMKDKHLANRRARCDLSSRMCSIGEFGAGKTQGDPADHRSLCRASRRARLLRHRLSLWP